MASPLIDSSSRWRSVYYSWVPAWLWFPLVAPAVVPSHLISRFPSIVPGVIPSLIPGTISVVPPVICGRRWWKVAVIHHRRWRWSISMDHPGRWRRRQWATTRIVVVIEQLVDYDPGSQSPQNISETARPRRNDGHHGKHRNQHENGCQLFEHDHHSFPVRYLLLHPIVVFHLHRVSIHASCGAQHTLRLK